MLFVAWQAYESRRNNQLALQHNKYIEQQHKEENAVKAIVRFDDKIMPDIRHLFHNASANLSPHDYLLSITLILKVNRWSVYVTSNIANDTLIESRLHDTLRNVSVHFSNIVNRINNSGIYNLRGYFELLHDFDIIK